MYCSLKRRGNRIARPVLYCNSGRLAKDGIAVHQVVLQDERGLGRDKCIATRLNDISHCIAIQCAWAARHAAQRAQERAHTPTTRRWRATLHPLYGAGPPATRTTRRVGARGKARRGEWHGAQGRAGERCDTAAWRCDTAGPSHDTAGPRATIRPMCAHLGVPGCPAWPVGCLYT